MYRGALNNVPWSSILEKLRNNVINGYEEDRTSY